MLNTYWRSKKPEGVQQKISHEKDDSSLRNHGSRILIRYRASKN